MPLSGSRVRVHDFCSHDAEAVRAHLYAILPGVGDPPVIDGVHDGAPGLVQGVPHHRKLLLHSSTAQAHARGRQPLHALRCCMTISPVPCFHFIRGAAVMKQGTVMSRTAFGSPSGATACMDGMRGWESREEGAHLSFLTALQLSYLR